MQELLRKLPAIRQIYLALRHCGYQLPEPRQELCLALPLLHHSQRLSELQFQYLDFQSQSQNQLLELRLPLQLRPNVEQIRELSPVISALNSRLWGLNLVAGAEGLCLRICTLHPEHHPDLKALVQLIEVFTKAWSLSYSLLAPYIQGRVGIQQLAAGLKI